MAFKIRSSKFRHIYGEAYRKERCYENVRITRNAHDSNFCAVNPKFIAVVTESAGGGAFVVLPLSRTGRVDINASKVCGHAGSVQDIKWNPFKDEIIASGADDNTVKIWQIPENGLRGNLTEWQVDLHGHGRRILYLDWHPTAENIILTAGADHKCIIWNVEQAEPVNVVSCHSDIIHSMSWSRDGSLFCTTCKDKTLRVIDPRAGTCVAQTDKFFAGLRPSKAVYLGDTGRIFCTGFENGGQRECAVWDVRNMSERLVKKSIDNSFGILIPYYDHDTRCVFLGGKGDGNISYYEIVNDIPYLHYLNNYSSSSPQRGLGVMPKRGCDPSKCEIMRFYKLHAARNYVEPVSMIVPRKTNIFHEDIFPPTLSAIPSLSADEWISGQNRDPILISMKDHEVVNNPQTTPSRAVQPQDGALNQAPTITTFKAISSQKSHQTIESVSTTAKREPKKLPASLRNIKQLSTSDDFVTIPNRKEDVQKTSDDQGDVQKPQDDQDVQKSDSEKEKETINTGTERAFVNSKIKAFERSTSSGNDSAVSPTQKRSERRSWTTSQENPPDVIANGMKSLANNRLSSKERPASMHNPAQFFEHKEIEIIEINRDSETSKINGHNDSVESTKQTPQKTRPSGVKLNTEKVTERKDQGDGHKIHVKKTWSPVKAPSNAFWEENALPNTDPELRKAYFRQAEEIKALREQVSLKDKRIRQLEDEVNVLRKGGGVTAGHEESDC